MKPKREQMLYHLSERLGIEILTLEVGKEAFIPETEALGRERCAESRRGRQLRWTPATPQRMAEHRNGKCLAFE